MAGPPATALQELYQAELRVRELEGRILQTRRVLEGDAGGADPRPRLLIAQSHRRELAAKLDRAEAHERSQRARARSHERQLYSGEIHSPKDLSQLAAELEQLKGRLAVEEVEELNLLQALEEAELEVERALAEASGARTALAECEDALTAALAAVERYRSEIPEGHRQLYDRVRAYRPAPPIAAVEGGLCTGCRIPLSISQSRALRFAAEPLVCETCGRILVLR